MKIKYIIIGFLSRILQKLRFYKLRLLGYKNISPSAIIESNLNLDRVFPAGIHIGENTLVASHTTILCHEHVKRDDKNHENPWITDTYIGKNSFIGVGSMILPGVKIGDEVIIGAASVVTKDIPSNTVAVGNPAKVIKTNIRMDNNAILIK
jgi:acetyltransferase-like isoleucine patch superfamily enzyme